MRLDVERVSLGRGGRQVLDGVSFSCERPALVGLIGPNGAGKTTLMRLVAGLARPGPGRVALDGKDTADMAGKERARRIAYLSQERSVSWPLACRDVVMLGRHPHRRPLAPPSPQDHEIVDRVMDELRIAPFAHRRIDTLSGGEKARVLIARALAQAPDVLLADEPTDALDPEHQIALMERLAQIARSGRLVMVTMHDLSLAARWCDRLIVLDRGRLKADGPPDETLTPQLLSEVYRIEAATLSWEGVPLVVPVRLAPRDDAERAV
ncbi:ABC transporter ATP-binding protein [Lutibaculum baratangense]|uniref:Vitamin B12 ABC transporter, ATPase component BtuD n=1 Tax=Lutibaculum baratangense AMV1 TaxID=631454 RepID=V4R3E9_9HYPH|nr:ABC transporter ATP-binding protein [Lutibaculum baratangense]ESR26447.1 Vitamin B12 ABC transporter, ATPase component BtuD [Lutibaculum baratangense AMV1]